MSGGLFTPADVQPAVTAHVARVCRLAWLRSGWRWEVTYPYGPVRRAVGYARSETAANRQAWSFVVDGAYGMKGNR